MIDTGIDANHRDLRDNLWKKPGTDEYGFDFVTNKKNPTDANGHGTHVAGIIGATAKGKAGAYGVAPNVSIMAIRYIGDNSSNSEIMDNLAKSIDYAIENGARIINISSAGSGFHSGEYRAIKRAGEKGILVVVAAGNSGISNDSSSPSYPASYKLPNILAVAATNIRNQLLPSSNYGIESVHVAAPGENIFSTLPENRYGYLSGTSQAAAFASGEAALILSRAPELKAEELKDVIMSSASKSTGLKDRLASGGRINAFEALETAIARIEKSNGRGIAAKER